MKPRTCPVCELHAESTFKIEGLDCHEEVAILERRLGRLDGIEHLSADVVQQRLRVKYDAARLSTTAIAQAVAETGMRAWLEHEEPVGPPVAARARQRLVMASGLCLAAGFALHFANAHVGARVAYGAAMVTGGLYTARRAIAAARAWRLDINVLMLVAVAGAIALGEWAEGATVIVLFAFAQWLEARTMDRARLAIRALMDLTPAEALVRRGAAEQRVGVDEVAVGDLIIVRPGEKIPLDGRVVAGESHVNQAPVTGESLPVDKQPGGEVFAGTINGRGALEIEVTRPRRDTTLARIIHLVERAQAQRAPMQSFVDRFARVYTPAVIAMAVTVAIVPPLVFGQPAADWFYRALVLLVISCPCALVISTPISIVSALAGAARKGVLIKGGIHLERTGRVRCVAFDKTGTLTHGQLHVVDVIAVNGATPPVILGLAASLERRSEHPIARAIVRHAEASGVDLAPSEGFQALTGLGAAAKIAGIETLVGSHRLFEERGLCSPNLHGHLDGLAAQGCTAVMVAQAGQTIGIIGVADQIREAGADAVGLLRQQGVEHVVLLTGDNDTTARAIARAVGIEEYRAELLPEDKVTAVEELRRRYGIVAMVGDGVNDAPALAAADVGMAMGAAGTDAALETADVALMADELLKIPYAVRLSRATLANIKANIAVSLGLKAAFLALAVAGMATLWMAVLADMGASMLVIANALRLLKAD